MIYFFYVLFFVVAWFMWNLIHELSHILAAKSVADIQDWYIIPYPHEYNGDKRFAGAYWHWGEKIPSNLEMAFISLAPRIPNIIVLGLIALSFLLVGPARFFLLIFCFEGLIDLIYGSVGKSENSDLMRAAKSLDISPWTLRIPGMMLALVGAVMLTLSFLSGLGA